jgi:hypothetical protein
MKTAIALLALCIAAVSAAETRDITLADGKVLRSARIVSIGSGSVTIVHGGGVITVGIDQVDLEIVARAKMELEESEARRTLQTEKAKASAEKQKAEKDQAHKDRVALALAESTARIGKSPSAPSAKKPALDRDAKVAALKATFPAKSSGSARVFIPRSGRNDKPYIVSSTVSQLPGGNTYASTTTRHNAGPGRIDTIQYDAPPAEVWSWYQGMFRTTTLQALPRTLEMVEKRLAEDTAKFQQAAGGSSMSGAAQAQHTLYWFQRVLRPHMGEWRSLLK